MGCFEEYAAAHQRIIDLVTDENSGTWVAACPGWSVKDVIAHLAGGLGDFVNRRLDLAGSAEWGERQVRERRDWPLQHSLAEWQQNLDKAADLLASPIGPVVVAEVISHEHDIRAALGHAGARHEKGVGTALHTFLVQFAHKINEAGLLSLRVVIDGDEHVLGDGEAGNGEPEVTLRASSFELMRALSGRRTRGQVALMDWTGDSTPYLDLFFVFGPAERELHE